MATIVNITKTIIYKNYTKTKITNQDLNNNIYYDSKNKAYYVDKYFDRKLKN